MVDARAAAKVVCFPACLVFSPVADRAASILRLSTRATVLRSFVIMIVGFVVVGLALFVEFTMAPAYWVHALLWVPLIFALSIGLLRPLKGFLIAQQYRHKAQEGQIAGRLDRPHEKLDMSESWRGLVVPGVAAGLAFAVLVTLGLWQLQRLEWKQALIARVAVAG